MTQAKTTASADATSLQDATSDLAAKDGGGPTGSAKNRADRLVFMVIGWASTVLIAYLGLYFFLVVLSVPVAHFLRIWNPSSPFASRVMKPITAGLYFLDQNWRSALVLLILPFLAPSMHDLASRIKKLWIFEFFPVTLVKATGKPAHKQHRSSAQKVEASNVETELPDNC